MQRQPLQLVSGRRAPSHTAAGPATTSSKSATPDTAKTARFTTRSPQTEPSSSKHRQHRLLNPLYQRGSECLRRKSCQFPLDFLTGPTIHSSHRPKRESVVEIALSILKLEPLDKGLVRVSHCCALCGLGSSRASIRLVARRMCLLTRAFPSQ